MTAGAPYPRLVGDIGGTHARFGWVQDALAHWGPVIRDSGYVLQ